MVTTAAAVLVRSTYLYKKVNRRQCCGVALFLDVSHHQLEDVGDPLGVQLQELGAAQQNVALQDAHRRLRTKRDVLQYLPVRFRFADTDRDHRFAECLLNVKKANVKRRWCRAQKQSHESD